MKLSKGGGYIVDARGFVVPASVVLKEITTLQEELTHAKRLLRRYVKRDDSCYSIQNDVYRSSKVFLDGEEK